VIYEGGGPFPGVIATAEPLGAPDTVLTATVGVNPAAASKLIIGGVPASPLRTILPLVSLAVALLGIAFVIARRRETMALELRARLSEARLGALRRQLQPHFLYNVLNSIAMLARRGDNKAVVAVINQLGDLLRVVLDESPAELVPLREEVAFIERYLALEKVRFQDRLDIVIDVPQELAEERVPAFILQPLVENALRHGIGGVESGGTVTVRARREASHLVLEVADTGRGSGNEAIVEGVGLRNTRARLAELYGESATLETVADAEGFTSSVRFYVMAESP
jgi:LytS/YehU family sensor histidine kinase